MILEVIDNGIGMNEEGMKKLFKPFSQADKSIQARYGGTGLGLWITYKLIALMKGKILVRSKPSKGTRFTLKIPVQAQSSLKIQPKSILQSSERRGPTFATGIKPTLTMDQFQANNLPQSKVIVFQNDEIMRNLFQKYFGKHKVQFKFVSTFKKLLKNIKVNQSI